MGELKLFEWDFKYRKPNKHKCLSPNCNTKIYEDDLFCKGCLKLSVITRLKIYYSSRIRIPKDL